MLTHLEHGLTDLIAVPDTHLVVGEPFDGEVLAELPRLEGVATDLLDIYVQASEKWGPHMLESLAAATIIGNTSLLGTRSGRARRAIGPGIANKQRFGASRIRNQNRAMEHKSRSNA